MWAKVLKQLLIGDELITEQSFMKPAKPAPAEPKSRPRLTEHELIHKESQIGAKLFGELPEGHRREFFNLDPSTWIWYDEWRDELTGQNQYSTIRYEVHQQGVLKVQEGAKYEYIVGDELTNFVQATEAYYQNVASRIYQEPADYRSIPTNAV